VPEERVDRPGSGATDDQRDRQAQREEASVSLRINGRTSPLVCTIQLMIPRLGRFAE
jgi:hypothetical protein